MVSLVRLVDVLLIVFIIPILQQGNSGPMCWH